MNADGRTPANIRAVQATDALDAPLLYGKSQRVRHEICKVADNRRVELRCTPPADMRYTVDVTSLQKGAVYT